MKKAWLLFLCKKGGFLMNGNSDNRTIAFLLILGFIAFAAFAVWETCKSRKRVFGKIPRAFALASAFFFP